MHSKKCLHLYDKYDIILCYRGDTMLMKALLVQDMVFFPHMSVEFSLNDEINPRLQGQHLRKIPILKSSLSMIKSKNPMKTAILTERSA